MEQSDEAGSTDERSPSGGPNVRFANIVDSDSRKGDPQCHRERGENPMTLSILGNGRQEESDPSVDDSTHETRDALEHAAVRNE